MARNQFSMAVAAILIALVAMGNGVPINELTPAQRARDAMQQTSWISIATISSNENTKGYPMVNVKSIADAGTGVPYFYFTDLDFSVIDINVDPRVSVLITLADGYCAKNDFDPQDPRCLRLILTGTVVKVKDEKEQEVAKAALIEKHPVIKEWENAHHFYVSKMVIERIALLDHFGGADIIDPAEYLAAEL